MKPLYNIVIFFLIVTNSLHSLPAREEGISALSVSEIWFVSYTFHWPLLCGTHGNDVVYHKEI